MIAYPKNDIEGIKIQDATKIWKENKLIGTDSLDKIDSSYKSTLYSPNIFIRIALFIFTCILIAASLGLLTLISLGGESEIGVGIRLIIYSVLTFFALEYFIKTKKTYRSGIDDALLYASLSLLLSGLGLIVFEASHSGYNENLFLILSFPILALAAIRYVDMLVTALAFACLFAIVFVHLHMGGAILQSILPFAGMALSLLVYFQSRKYQSSDYLVWWNNLFILEFLTLICFYLCGNYFVVRELSIELLEVDIPEGKDIPLAFVFYIFTALVPLFYIVRSIQTKDRMMLRAGLFILALSVLTFKYYFSLGHHEITLTVSGIAMIGITWALMRYLQTPKLGLTSQEDKSILNTDIEAFIISESFGKNDSGKQGSSFEFGGGDSGGGGSSGKF